MPKLPKRRPGTQLLIKNRSLNFSYWPMYKSKTKAGLQATLFSTNPWGIIEAAIAETKSNATYPEANACLIQAQHLYMAAVDATLWAAKPLLFYYSYLNLLKSYALQNGHQSTFDRVQHGIASYHTPGGDPIEDAGLNAFASPNQRNQRQAFAEFIDSLSGFTITDTSFPLPHLIATTLTGHRVWAECADEQERFLAIEELRIQHSKTRQEIWADILIPIGDITRLGLNRKKVLDLSGLGGTWSVVDDIKQRNRTYICLQQNIPIKYTTIPSEHVNELAASVSQHLHTIVTSIPPYRKHYLYLCPVSEQPSLLPQLMSMYAVMFFFGSVTRYRPQDFDTMLTGQYGDLIQEILSDQPKQFIYLIASEFSKREVTRPAIV